MAYSARPTSTDLLTKQISQVAHGFVVGNIVFFNGATYALAQADSLADCQGAMIVSILIDANTFYVTQVGYVTGLTGPFTPGAQYYISPSVAGALTVTKPTTFGQVVAAVFIADSAISGFYATDVFDIVGSAPFIDSYLTVTMDTVMTPNVGYFTNSGILLNMTLPPVIAAGQSIEVIGINTGGFSILQNAGQTINFVPDQTTVGVAGSILLDLSSGVLRGSIKIICYTDNTDFQVIDAIGNFSVA